MKCEKNSIEEKISNLYSFNGLIGNREDLEITKEHINKSFEIEEIDGYKYLLCFYPKVILYLKL